MFTLRNFIKLLDASFYQSIAMNKILDWPNDEPFWTPDTFKLLYRDELHEPANPKLEEIIEKSKEFPVKFPISTVLCSDLKKNVHTDILERNVNSVYPLLHENVLLLCAHFILHKRQHGHSKDFYENMNVIQLVERLLQQRAVVFVGESDNYLLMDGTQGMGEWEIIGSDKETVKLNLNKCLSYDEIKLSAFLSVSSYTYFINNGNRTNGGSIPRDRKSIEDEGIIIGLIGTRMEKPYVMEYEDIVVTEEQNNKERGFGTGAFQSTPALFAKFYEKPCYTYDYVSKTKWHNEHFSCQYGTYFDNFTYSKRLGLSLDILFVEANERAKSTNTTSFIHVVGIGLGAWKISDHQSDLFLQTCARRIEVLGKHLHYVSDVFFDYFPDGSTCGQYKSGDIIPIDGHPKTGIKVHIGKRDPHEKLTGEHKGKLLVVSYAWDANALPGNEFWYGSLHTSGDPAAACSTQIAELHNPHINPKVSAHNLRVVTPEGVVPIKEYQEKIKNKYAF